MWDAIKFFTALSICGGAVFIGLYGKYQKKLGPDCDMIFESLQWLC